MGVSSSSLIGHKAAMERKLEDYKRQLTRVLSKSNSMESLDKAEIKEIKLNIKKTESVLDLVNRVIEDEHAPSF